MTFTITIGTLREALRETIAAAPAGADLDTITETAVARIEAAASGAPVVVTGPQIAQAIQDAVREMHGEARSPRRES